VIRCPAVGAARRATVVELRIDQSGIAVGATLRVVGKPFGGGIDGIQQRLASGVDCREIALKRCRDNGRIAALVIPCRVGSQRRKVCRERRDCVVVCGLFGGDAVGCGLPVDPGLFRGDDIVVTDDGRLFGRR